MPGENPAGRLWRATVYRAKLCLLTLFGPATLDAEHDPIVQLKREHQRQKGGGRVSEDSRLDRSRE